MKYLLKYSIVLTFLLLLFSSCREEPVYDIRPHIEFNRIEEFLYNQQNVQFHQLSIVVNFKDGDGNLGLSRTAEVDKQPPFDFGSPYNDNFVVRLFIKYKGTNEFIDAGTSLSGRFPRLSSDERNEPLEGEIKLTLKESFSNDIFQQGDIVKFDVYIYDRTLPIPLQSNTVTTREVVLFE